ncbi:MAG: ribonuclease J [Candidatus Komeilibacteria bacterium CG10_big_fil_rev_8_21_14_0_10_41_13]|uniref:Ribonuclease J n=1 Tax=Candidatus Komeilibacteria bacterium CG10_big_fil_rev_8_21_14_0_10_41_13 TaxID=1974476 RepID=A0A2M6WD21_9BACT|nr:MAG: ribonuclease J [Candidatus Komeilibacteria bacterium CG10_big_fil_rev_8_21_14_0_10_41_13]
MTEVKKKTTRVRTTTRGRGRSGRSRSSVRKSDIQSSGTQINDKNNLKVMVVGGNEEVGRNMTILEYGQDIIIIDLGLQFPEEDMPGIDYIIPNISYLRDKTKNIRGIFITHAHLDHIGAIPHVMADLGNPTIYSSDLSLAIIAKRQDDFKESPKLKMQAVSTNDVIRAGIFKVSFFGVSHNIPTSMGLIIDTPVGKVVHTGDFKIDVNEKGAGATEINKIKKLGQQNVLALLTDSTNASHSGRQLSESEIKGNLEDIIKDAPGRIIMGTFASLLGRIQQIIWAAEKHGKKVVIEGYSMKTNAEIAKALGYLKIKKDTVIEAKDMEDYPKNKILIICTGAQGEGRAVLMRIANHEHKSIRIESGDTVVFSSSVIPGNERSVQRLKDSLYREGAEVIHYQMMDVHAGGHAKAEDIKYFISLVKPKYFIPIEGHHSFLRLNAKNALAAGVDKHNIFVADNGQIIEFSKRGGRLTDKKIPSDYVFVDGLGVGDVSNIVIRDRQMMAADGMIVVIATIRTKNGQLVQNPDLISRGFIYMKENKKLVEDTRKKVRALLKDYSPKTSANDTYIKDKIRNEVGKFLFQKTERRPMVLPVIIEV